MPLMSVPFKLPAPYPLPAGLTESLRRQPFDKNVEAVMHLLIQEDMADIALLETLQGGVLQVTATQAKRNAETLKALEGQANPQAESLAAKALEAGTPLLVMGEVEPGESGFSPALVERLLADRPKADLGFAYVIPLVGDSGARYGVLTLIRGEGPLNHDQPAIVQAFTQWLAYRLDNPTTA